MRPDTLSPLEACTPPLAQASDRTTGVPRYSVLSVAGSRHNEFGIPNQDAYAARPGGVYAVADGHGPGGREAAQAAVNALVGAAHLGLHEAFRRAADAVDAVPGAENSGATATLAVVHAGTRVVEIGNVGDSDAVLASGRNDKSRRLTIQHRPENETERARVLACGALVDNGYVVDGPEPHKMISITRSFGDRDVRSLGIISKPDCCTIHLTDDDDYLILATDGLWDAHGGDITAERVSEIVRQLGADDGCHHLVELAAGSSSYPIDDCTVLVVPLSTPSQPASCSAVRPNSSRQ